MSETTHKRPPLLYKYTSVEVAKIILKDLTLKFSSPLEFNDPFDCDIDLVDFDFSGQIDDFVRQEISELKKQYKSHPLITEKLDNPEFLHTLYKEAQINKIRSSKVCCFSLAKDIILMWSHYAEKHAGICLEFNNDSLKKFVSLTDDEYSEGVVGYTADKKINYVSQDRSFSMQKLYMNKSHSWSHENEYRMFTINDTPGLQRIYPEFLSAIYFGLRTSEDDVSSIKLICKSNGLNNIKFYKATKGVLKVDFTLCN